MTKPVPLDDYGDAPLVNVPTFPWPAGGIGSGTKIGKRILQRGNGSGKGTINVDDLSSSGRLLDPSDKSGQLTRAGRQLQKHGGRAGSAFPKVKGTHRQSTNRDRMCLMIHLNRLVLKFVVVIDLAVTT